MADAAQPVFFYDYSSVYAYLAVCRLDAVLPVAPEWHPVWLPAVFAATGRESWAFTDRREEGLAEVERRAADYGVPYQRSDHLIDKFATRGSLLAQRGGAIASQAGLLEPYSREVFDRLFARGEDITAPETIAAAANAVGLDGEETVRRCAEQDVKDWVKQRTEDAIGRGVFGVPTIAVDGELFWGDDRLEEAAAACRR